MKLSQIVASFVAVASASLPPQKAFRIQSDNVRLSSNKNLEDLHLTNLVIVSQIDGTLSGLNRHTGEIVWSRNFGPAIQTKWAPLVENGTVNHNENEEFWAVEPFGEGGLYYFTMDQDLTKIPLSVKQLVAASPFSIDNDDKVFTGSRKTDMLYLNVQNGEPVSNASSNLTLAIGQIDYEFVIRSKNDNIMWNISMTKLSENNVNNDLKVQNLKTKSADGALIFPFQENSLLSIDMDSNIPKWVTKLNATCINVFDVYSDLSSNSDNKFILVSHPMSESPETNFGTYLGYVDRGSWYAMSSENYPSLVKSSYPALFYDVAARSKAGKPLKNPVELLSGVHKSEKDSRSKTTDSSSSTTTLALDSSNRVKDLKNFPSLVENGQLSTLTPTMYSGLPASEEDIALTLEPPMKDRKTHSVLKLLFRLFENGVFTVVLLAFVYYASRVGFIPPLTTIMYKLGFMKRTHYAIEFAERIMADTEISVENATRHEDQYDTDAEDSDSEELGEKMRGSETKSQRKAVKIDVDPEKEISKLLDDDTASPDSKDDYELEEIAEEPDKDDDKGDIEESGEVPLNGKKLKKRKRGSRGGKNKKKVRNGSNNGNSTNNVVAMSNINEEINGNDIELIVKQNNKLELGKSKLVISDDVLGYGSHGTVVYRGTFENRPVAVKRMLIDFYDVASHEVSLLQESDDHPNVIRYFCSRQSDRFLYIALELCSANLEDLAEKSGTFDGITWNTVETNFVDVLYQMTSGLNHLHKLNIVHRDIKPQNILVSPSKTNSVRVLISDFGLCKKLEPDQSSFRGTTNSGTSGWRAPELLDTDTSGRISKGVDIFSLGLVFYYTLTKGKHPFGDKYNRESNIIQNKFDLSGLDTVEAKDMISKMLYSNSRKRLSCEKILKHPFFWSNEKKIEFLLKVSDKLNILPKEDLILEKFESKNSQVFEHNDWKLQFDDKFFANLNTFRKYNSGKLVDLLRVIRNKYHHINEIPVEFGITEENFYEYFRKMFPNLLVYTYYFVEQKLISDFESYY